MEKGENNPGGDEIRRIALPCRAKSLAYIGLLLA